MIFIGELAVKVQDGLLINRPVYLEILA